MKVLYYTNIPSPYRVEFFNQLSKNCEVTVLFNGDPKEKNRNEKWYQNNEYQFKAIKLKKMALFQLLKILKEKYDVVIIGTYANMNGAILNYLLRIKKIKFFINADGGIVPEKESILSKFLKHYFISAADYYLSSGYETNKYLEFYGAKREKIYIYPFTSLKQNDLNKKRLSYEEKRKLRKQKGFDYERLFVSVGSFIHRKGYDLLLEAIFHQKEKDSNGYLIIGGGEEFENLVKKQEEYHLKNVHFIDFCSKEEVLEFYRMSDIFLMPTREDIWGLVILEAMSCGLPVISSDKAMASKELLDSKYLYPVHDIHQLSALLDQYTRLSNNELEKVGQDNYKKVSHYTIEEMTKRHLEIFKEVKK